MEIEKTFTQMSFDSGLAKAVWELTKVVDGSDVEMVALCLVPTKDGKHSLQFKPYTPGDEEEDENMVASLSVSPSVDDGAEVEDPELCKALRFMYFYQSAYATLVKNVEDYF